MRSTRLARTARILLILGLPAFAACSKNDAARSDGDGGPAAHAVLANAVGMDAGGDAAAAGGEDVEPVYPIETDAPIVPLAAKLCAAMSELPEKRRAECCAAKPGVVVTSECTRTLSAALRHQAVAILEADVTACIAALERTLAGCDWVGPFAPGPPAACLGIIQGRLAAGQKCRSSLECAGSLRCLGAGPTTAGTCGPAKAVGELCGGTVDTLAGYTRQTDIDARHPECRDKCIKHRCAPAIVEGSDCRTTADCAGDLQCVPTPPSSTHKKCLARPRPKEGEPCPGGVCDGELQCIKSRCTARKAAGESCTADFECRGGCLHGDGDGGAAGTCGPRCDLR